MIVNYHDEQLREFKQSVDYWITVLGITGWDYQVVLEQLDSNMAEVHYNCLSKLATFKLTRSLEGTHLNPMSLHDMALHEVIHLMIAEYGWVVGQVRSDTDKIAIALEHSLINRLTKVLSRKE